MSLQTPSIGLGMVPSSEVLVLHAEGSGMKE